MADSRGLGLDGGGMILTRGASLVGGAGTSGVTAPRVSEFNIGGAIKGALVGIATGNPVGIIGGAIAGGLGSDLPTSAGGFAPAGTGTCPEGTFRLAGRCISPGDAPPGGAPFISRPSGNGQKPEMGVFGLLSVEPSVVGEISGKPILRCPHRGLVLGKDDRCYSRKDLPKKLRKWKPRRPKLSVTDRRMKDVEEGAKAAKALAGAFKGSGYTLKRNR